MKDKRFKLNDKQIKEICRQYKDGRTSPELASLFGVSAPTIARWLKHYGLNIRGSKKLSNSDLEAIREIFAISKNAAEIARIFGVDFKTITYHLDKWNLKRNRFTYSIKHQDYFSKIDSEHKAYWIGLFLADGCIFKRSLQVKFKESDRILLETFLSDIGANHPIYSTEWKGRKYCGIQITAPRLVEDLQRYGVVPRKTTKLSWPQEIPVSYLNHFMRGFADGDGGFYTYRSNSSLGFSFSVSCGSPSFLTRYCESLAQAIEAPTAKIIKQKGHNTFQFSYSGRLRVKSIFDFLYFDATIWLPRKREKIAPYL